MPGIDVGSVTDWLVANVAGARGPFAFDAHRRRPLEPDLPRHRRRRTRASCCAARRSATCSPAPTTWVASTGSSPACRAPRVPVPPALGLLRRPVGQRRAVLRDGLRRRPRRARPRRRPRRSLDAGARGERQPIDRRHAGRHPRRRPRRRRPRRPRPARGLHRPPAQALVRPVEPAARPASSPRSTRSTTPCSIVIPEQGPATIVHGDYRLDNCMVDDDGDVVAVLDWEICTLGDPLADVGLLQVYWTGPDDAAVGVDRHRHHRAGLPGPRRARRPLRRGVGTRRIEHLDFYVAFALLEARLHPRGRVLPLPRRRPRRARAPTSSRRSSCRSRRPRARAEQRLEALP